MAVGLGVLKLAPGVFWSMSPKELAAALGAISPSRAPGPPSRAELDNLMSRYPDRMEVSRA